MLPSVATLLLLGAGLPAISAGLRQYLQLSYTKLAPVTPPLLITAKYMHDHRRGDDEISTAQPGYLAMFSGCEIFDLTGRVSPKLLSKYSKVDSWEAAAQRGSRWIVAGVPRDSFTTIGSSSFLAKYSPYKTWLLERTSIMVFRRMRDPVLGILGSAKPGSAGVYPAISGSHFVVTTEQLSPERLSSQFRYWGDLCRLDVQPYSASREPLRGQVQMDDYASTSTDEAGIAHLLPTRHIDNGFTISVETSAPKAWIMLKQSVRADRW